MSSAGSDLRDPAFVGRSETFGRIDTPEDDYPQEEPDTVQLPLDAGILDSEFPDVDVGVVYTYEDDLLAQLLLSLREAAAGVDARLIFVDNNSQKDISRWSQTFARTKVVANCERLSYASNLNRIMAAARAKYVLLLNTDVYFAQSEPCLWNMVRFMESHPRCGIATCRIYNADGNQSPSARRFQSVPIILARRFGLGKLMPQVLDDYFYADRDMSGEWECDWVSGCFMMLRTDAFRQVGPFDEKYGKYFEDVDMCLRMAKGAWRVMYNGATFCYHLEQRASHRLLSSDARQHAVAYLRWLRKGTSTLVQNSPRKRAA